MYPLICSFVKAAPLRRLLLFILLVLSTTARADDPLAHVFQDNMVLQREMPVPIWGWAAPGTDVDVTFAGQTKHAHADATGYWKAILDPLTASRENRVLTAKIGSTVVTRKNVLVGEVWVATGQSNMVVGGPDVDTGVYPFYVSPGTRGGKPEIRILKYGAGVSLEPVPDGEPDGTSWVTLAENPPDKEMNIPPYFARVIRDALDVPVGVIEVAVPGTNQTAWMAKETLKQFPGDGGHPDFYESFLAQQAGKSAASTGPFKSFNAFKEAEDAWRQTKVGVFQGRASGLEFSNYPTALYNTRIFPLAPFAIRGMIWHQGEGGPAPGYGKRLAAMFNQWRALYGEDFYVIWGTLGRATTEPPPLAPVRSSFYRSDTNLEIRLATDFLGKNSKSALVEFFDLGNDGTHWTEKAEAGRRMGLAALTLAYGQPRVYTGPRAVESKLEGGKAIVRFDHVGAGLVYQPSIDDISGVYLRGKTGDPHWAQVKITGKDTAEFSFPGVTDPEIVAYANNNNPHETLFNSEGLPASPFTVGASTARDPAPGAVLVALTAKTPGIALHIAHVRHDGYMFELKAARKGAPGDKASITAYIPAAWKAFELQVAGAKIEPPATTPAADGGRTITFDAPTDASWIVIAEAGKIDQFRKVDRY